MKDEDSFAVMAHTDAHHLTDTFFIFIPHINNKKKKHVGTLTWFTVTFQEKYAEE